MASIVKQLEAQRKSITEMQERLDAGAAQNESLVAAMEQLKTEHAEAITALRDELARAADATAAEVEKGAALAATIDQLNAANALLEAEKTEVHAEVEKLQQALADPAYAAAAAQGETPVDGSGEAKESMTHAEAVAAYVKIENAAEREKFRTEHRVELGL